MSTAILDQLDTYGPDRCEQLDYEQASSYVSSLAKTHYENFAVVSFMLPRRLRTDFRHIYAFCRWADDLGDETGDPARSIDLLNWWRRELNDCYAGKPRHPVFVALQRTIEKHDVPREPFDHLIDAFIQDQSVTRYESWNQVLDYCARSANPVGRLVLYLCGYRNVARQTLSDATCTALQLANFWQDVRRDVLERDRVYIPRQVATKYGLSIETLVQVIRNEATDAERRRAVNCPACAVHDTVGSRAILPACCQTIKHLVDDTWPLFRKGRELWPLVSRDVRADIKLFTFGGEKVLRMIERCGYNTLQRRPKLGVVSRTTLLLRALWGKMTGF